MRGPLPLLVASRLEKAARDNGFDLRVPDTGAWLAFRSSQTRLGVWLTAVGDDLFVLAVSRRGVFEGLDGLGVPWASPLPADAGWARSVTGHDALHALVRRAFQLARALPDAPLERFVHRTRGLPTTTEAERLVVQRVGQDVFREGLLDYWQGRCAVTGLAVERLLRASHIKPWAACEADAERLDVFNGLLLAPHLDAAFDAGLLTFDPSGRAVLSARLDADARSLLGLSPALALTRRTDAHEAYLAWHRARVFTPT
jgi:putative restriction endonuclease